MLKPWLLFAFKHFDGSAVEFKVYLIFLYNNLTIGYYVISPIANNQCQIILSLYCNAYFIYPLTVQMCFEQ